METHLQILERRYPGATDAIDEMSLWEIGAFLEAIGYVLTASSFEADNFIEMAEIDSITRRLFVLSDRLKKLKGES